MEVSVVVAIATGVVSGVVGLLGMGFQFWSSRKLAKEKELADAPDKAFRRVQEALEATGIQNEKAYKRISDLDDALDELRVNYQEALDQIDSLQEEGRKLRSTVRDLRIANEKLKKDLNPKP